MHFETKNSVYEIDLQNKKIRRRAGVEAPLDSFEDDEIWKTYKEISKIEKDSRVLIIWLDSSGSVLSKVVSIDFKN